MNNENIETSEQKQENTDLRCVETRLSRLITGKDNGELRVSPIFSLRNRPNADGVVFKYGKKKGKLKPCKHKDFQ